MAVSLALLANLYQCGNGEDKDGIDAWSMSVIFLFYTHGIWKGEQHTNHAKEGGKDDVESNVGKARDGSRTATE